jgi:hypothetical protein
MTPESVQSAVGKLEKTMQQAGAANFEQGMDVVCRLFEFFLEQCRAIKTREQATAVLSGIEASPEEEQWFLSVLDAMPELLGKLLGTVAERYQAQHPLPQTGRHHALALQDQAAACDYVALLHRQGVTMQVAKRRAAQRFSVSDSTIARLWRDRAKIGFEHELLQPVTPEPPNSKGP